MPSSMITIAIGINANGAAVFKNITARKNKGWSDTQVVIRFTILQIIVNLCFMAFVL